MFASLVYVRSKEDDQNEPEPHKRTLRLFSTKACTFVHATLAGTGPIAVLILTAHRKGRDLEGEIDRIQNQRKKAVDCILYTCRRHAMNDTDKSAPSCFCSPQIDQCKSGAADETLLGTNATQ